MARGKHGGGSPWGWAGCSAGAWLLLSTFLAHSGESEDIGKFSSSSSNYKFQPEKCKRSTVEVLGYASHQLLDSWQPLQLKCFVKGHFC